jgi:hypothetical protein
LGKGRNIASERGIVDLVNENTEEGGGCVVGIGLELGVELNDKCGGDCREQTSLCPQLV